MTTLAHDTTATFARAPGRPQVAGLAAMDHPAGAADAILNLLVPLWQGLIGLCVAAALAVVAWRLARRGPSRMGTALLVTGAAIVALAVVGILTGDR